MPLELAGWIACPVAGGLVCYLCAGCIAGAAGAVLAFGIPAVSFLQVAGGRGDLGAFAAV